MRITDFGDRRRMCSVEIRSGTALPRICWRTVTIFGRCKNSWGTRTSKRPWSTRMCCSAAGAGCGVRSIRAEEYRKCKRPVSPAACAHPVLPSRPWAPRATESHHQPRTHSCGKQPASIISLRGASVAYPTKAGSTSFANSRICRLISSIRSSRKSRTSRKEHTRWCNPAFSNSSTICATAVTEPLRSL